MRDPLLTADGLPLARCDWPAEGAARGSVLIVHGLGEHGERYVRLAADLTAAGWQVETYDQRGHGASAGRRGAIARPDSLLADLRLVLRTLRDEQAPRPRVLFGHSMGGALAARLVAEAPDVVDGLVLSSPALDTGLGALTRIQLAVLAPLAPDWSLHNGLAPAWISRDPRVVRNYVDDSRVHDRITPRLARCIVEAGRVSLAAAAHWRTPTLLLWAGADRCVSPRGSAAFAAAAPPAVVRSRCFPRLAHEIFNEPERATVVAELIGWLGALKRQREAQFGRGTAAAGSMLRSLDA